MNKILCDGRTEENKDCFISFDLTKQFYEELMFLSNVLCVNKLHTASVDTSMKMIAYKPKRELYIEKYDVAIPKLDLLCEENNYDVVLEVNEYDSFSLKFFGKFGEKFFVPNTGIVEVIANYQKHKINMNTCLPF